MVCEHGGFELRLPLSQLFRMLHQRYKCVGTRDPKNAKRKFVKLSESVCDPPPQNNECSIRHDSDGEDSEDEDVCEPMSIFLHQHLFREKSAIVLRVVACKPEKFWDSMNQCYLEAQTKHGAQCEGCACAAMFHCVLFEQFRRLWHERNDLQLAQQRNREQSLAADQAFEALLAEEEEASKAAKKNSSSPKHNAKSKKRKSTSPRKLQQKEQHQQQPQMQPQEQQSVGDAEKQLEEDLNEGQELVCEDKNKDPSQREAQLKKRIDPCAAPAGADSHSHTDACSWTKVKKTKTHRSSSRKKPKRPSTAPAGGPSIQRVYKQEGKHHGDCVHVRHHRHPACTNHRPHTHHTHTSLIPRKQHQPTMTTPGRHRQPPLPLGKKPPRFYAMRGGEGATGSSSAPPPTPPPSPASKEALQLPHRLCTIHEDQQHACQGLAPCLHPMPDPVVLLRDLPPLPLPAMCCTAKESDRLQARSLFRHSLPASQPPAASCPAAAACRQDRLEDALALLERASPTHNAWLQSQLISLLHRLSQSSQLVGAGGVPTTAPNKLSGHPSAAVIRPPSPTSPDPVLNLGVPPIFKALSWDFESCCSAVDAGNAARDDKSMDEGADDCVAWEQGCCCLDALQSVALQTADFCLN